MKRATIFLLLLFNTSSAYSESSLITVCDQMDKVSALIAPITVNPFQTLQITPLGPVPGIILAMVQPESVILDMCKMYKNLQIAKGLDKIRMLGDYTNILTDNKFSEHISFMKDTLDMGDTLNDINKLNQPSLDKFKAVAPKINSYFGSINDYYKYNTGKRIETLTSRSERESDMNELATSSRELAVYGSILDCDTANTRSNSDTRNLYSRDISNYENERIMYKSDIDYLIDRLKTMGIKFNNGNKGYESYLKDLYNLYNLGVEYTAEIRSYSEKTDSQNPGGKIKKVPSLRSYQVVATKNNPAAFDEFQKKYKPLWNDYIFSNMTAETDGLLDGRSGRVQEDFYDYSFECRDSYIYDKVKAKKPDYFIIENDPKKILAIESETQSCQKQVDRSPGKIKNLLVEYSELLKTTIPKFKEAQAKIWTIDSYYNGSFRSFTKGIVGNDPKGPVREEVSCSKNINLIEQANVKLKIKATNARLRQRALEELNKETINDERARAESKANMEEEGRNQLLENENARRNSYDYNKIKGYPGYSGSI